MKILRIIKKKIYFFVAGWFRFWAGLYLNRWDPKVIAIIGSSGKTTLLHLFEAQLGSDARYSHHANSAFGIPFHILGLERKSFGIIEWPLFAICAPFKIFRALPKEKLYIAEADAERPGEGKFLAELLKPEAVVWLSLEEAHGVNYDRLVSADTKNSREAVKDAMANEFGYFLEYTKDFCVLNVDNQYIVRQSKRTKSKVIPVSEKEIRNFKVMSESVEIETLVGDFSLPRLVPPASALSVVAVSTVLKTIGAEVDPSFKNFALPPGRSSVFQGIRNTILIDSSYNATMDGVRTMLDLVRRYPATGEKWLVLGDMIEQGKSEEAEHTDIVKNILDVSPSRVVLVGPRLTKYTYPLLLKNLGEKKIVAFLMPGEALEYLKKDLKGGETILFKGARYLEGVVEKLLLDPKDALKLCRREAIWVNQRKKWEI
ncbi:MAG: cyanophycin synthetase [Candidatus Pacebacteria bacterium]|nr:cyanophycin synthetase [Candidatus Paceibacterota bacterium]